MVTASLVNKWFMHACEQMQGHVQGCVYLAETETGPFTFKCAAVSSEAYTVSELVQKNINGVIKRRRSIVARIASSNATQLDSQQLSAGGGQSVTSIGRAIDQKNFLVTCPIIIDRELIGVMSVEFKHEPNVNNQDYLQQAENATRWLEFLSKSEPDRQAITPGADLAIQITALTLGHDSSVEAASAVVTQLATDLSCERVSLCFLENNELSLFALSHSARYETKQNLIKRIEAAVEESVIQKETLIYPVTETSPYSMLAHIVLAEKYSSVYICTVPLIQNEQVIGGIIFERSEAAGEFDQKTIELCEQVCSLFAPILEYRRLDDRPFSVKVRDSLKTSGKGFLGRGHLGFKLGSVIAAIVFSLLFFMQWEYRVTAHTVLEGSVERVVTAAEEGFIKTAVARPGDIVTVGQMLVTLDDRDLTLEMLKWSGKQRQIAKEYRGALASRNKSQVSILRARNEQAQTQIDILEKKLGRAVINAPIAGVVVSGDFTQSIGSPVERGQILYTISPLDQYRVLLDIDETEIAEIQVGMKGELTLSAEADVTYEISIDKITPVSTPGDGINYFKVEASLTETPEYLRPGMQGVSKISIGERQLLWIWTHKMVDWLRLQIWAWY